MRRKHTPPRSYKGPRPVSAELDPAVVSERAAAAARGLVLAGVSVEAIAHAVAQVEQLALAERPFAETQARLLAFCQHPMHQRTPRLARLLKACAAGASGPGQLAAQLKFLRRIRMLAGFAVALDLATGLEKDEAKRRQRQDSVRRWKP